MDVITNHTRLIQYANNNLDVTQNKTNHLSSFIYFCHSIYLSIKYKNKRAMMHDHYCLTKSIYLNINKNKNEILDKYRRFFFKISRC